jgi:hypothetical protein
MEKPALVASLRKLAARADEFGRSSWTGPSRAELEKAIILVEPLLGNPTEFGEDVESLRQEVQSNCRALLAKLKTAKVNSTQLDVDSQALFHACNRMLSVL